MKFILSLLLSATLVFAQYPDYKYTVQSGMGSGASSGNYTSFTLNFPDAHFDAANPPAGKNSLTTVENADGSPMTDYEIWQSQSLFSAGSTFSLQSLQITGGYTNGTSFAEGLVLKVTDSQGITLTSNAVVKSNATVRDPFDGSTYFVSGKDIGTFTFSTEVSMIVGQSYSFQFVNASGTSVTTRLTAVQGSNIGALNGNYAPSITAIGYIPEPGTATLSVLALAGLVLRRRRKV